MDRVTRKKQRSPTQAKTGLEWGTQHLLIPRALGW